MLNKDAVQQKADNLADRINEISKKFEVADEIIGDDVVEFIEEKTLDIELYSDDLTSEEVINLRIMVDDFKFIRETLQEIIKNGRRVLSSVTMDLLEEDGDARASLIVAFSELNNSISNNMKIYTKSYQELSNVLVNLHKLKAAEGPKSVTNNVSINTSEPVSTVDLIASLKDKNDIYKR